MPEVTKLKSGFKLRSLILKPLLITSSPWGLELSGRERVEAGMKASLDERDLKQGQS